MTTPNNQEKTTTSRTRRKTEKPYRSTKSKVVQDNLDVLMGKEELTNNTLSLENIVLPLQQPRRYFDPIKLTNLKNSIAQQGILEPLLVRPLNDGKYELVAGERRLRVARELQFSEVPVVIKELSDIDALQVALTENLQREDLNPLEQTESILQLLALRLEMSIEEVISFLNRWQNELKGKVTDNVVGKSEKEIIEKTLGGLITFESFMTHRLRLLHLPDSILAVLRQGKIAYTKAIALSKIKDEQKREELLQEVISSNLSLQEIKNRIKEISPKQTTETPSNRLKNLVNTVNKAKPWEKDQKKWQKIDKLIQQIESLIEMA